jgi:hypothetical protein
MDQACSANALSSGTATKFAGLMLPSEWFKEFEMQRPAEMDIVRRAYELWEQAGNPDGRDQEFLSSGRTGIEKRNRTSHPRTTALMPLRQLPRGKGMSIRDF